MNDFHITCTSTNNLPTQFGTFLGQRTYQWQKSLQMIRQSKNSFLLHLLHRCYLNMVIFCFINVVIYSMGLLRFLSMCYLSVAIKSLQMICNYRNIKQNDLWQHWCNMVFIYINFEIIFFAQISQCLFLHFFVLMRIVNDIFVLQHPLLALHGFLHYHRTL